MCAKKYSHVLKNIGLILAIGVLTGLTYTCGKCIISGMEGNWQKVKEQRQKNSAQKQLPIRFTPSQTR